MQPRTILLIEDDALQSKLTEKIIKGINCSVIINSKGKEALKTIEDDGKNIELVLLDLSLPDIGGIQLLKEIKKKNNDIPIAVLSANEEVSIVVEAIKAGADNFFIKYKDENELARLLNYINENI